MYAQGCKYQKHYLSGIIRIHAHELIYLSALVLMVSSVQLDYKSSSQCKLRDAYVDVNIVTKISKES